MRITPLALACFALLPLGELQAQDKTRPNILWITVEDMSANLGCYGDRFASTPVIDRFAKQAVRYTHAFATAPVCSPSRSCLITGVRAVSLGTQRLRSAFPIPKNIKGFPAYLRKAGYFTSNNVKTDYNIANEQALIRECWDRNGAQAHWRQRQKDQPFFSVFNLMTTHQSRTSVWPYEQFEKEVAKNLSARERHKPADVPLPPYYPDTPSVRRTVARYYDCIAVMDKQVGQLLRQLEKDGLAESTIVFFYSDHGMGLPRGKRLLHDSGMHVPLLVRFPKAFQHLAPAGPGQTVDDLVCFVDFAPTVLGLAQVKTPKYMQGLDFFKKPAEVRREQVFGARDRVDEVFELSRSVRDRRYLHIRNFMPHLSWMPPERYSDNSIMRRELKQMRKEGRLQKSHLTYASPRKPVEELYDTQADPHQIRNMAADPGQQQRLTEMRSSLQRWMLHVGDLGFLTEPQVWQRLKNDAPYDLRLDPKRYPLKSYLPVANTAGDPAAAGKQVEWLGHPDDCIRYWAAVGLHATPSLSAPAKKALHMALKDFSSSVRVEAAAALATHGDVKSALPVLTAALAAKDPETVLQAIRSLELLGEAARPARSSINNVLSRAKQEEAKGRHPCWMFVRFSAEAALDEFGPGRKGK